MAKKQIRLTVTIAPLVLDELSRIWQWNASQYGPSHADAYLRYLKTAIHELVHCHAMVLG
jgi:plasmid stabilization system protein ParE